MSVSIAVEVKYSLKVTVNKEGTKVLFAEADSHFADALLSFLTLPLGKIVRILSNHYRVKVPIVIGSLSSLYNGIVKLDSVYWWCGHSNYYLLDPKGLYESECRKLKLSVDGSKPEPTEYIKWVHNEKKRKICAGESFQPCTAKGQSSDGKRDDGVGVFTTNEASFLISDDLRIAPVVPGSILKTLINLGITDTAGATIRTVTLGFDEIMHLLKGSLTSETPLTDFILHKTTKTNNATGDLLHKIEKELPSANPEKMIIKAMIQKSTNKLLFAEAEENFVDLIFSLLTIPLGAVECLLGGKTSLKNIENFYRSVTDLIDDKYWKTKDAKTMLLRPKLSPYYISKNQILPFAKEGLICSEEVVDIQIRIQFARGSGKYVRPAMYMVTDDLIVTPFCFSSSLSILNQRKVSLSDVKEIDLQIGPGEALSILKASLASTSALTNGLANCILGEQPKP